MARQTGAHGVAGNSQNAIFSLANVTSLVPDHFREQADLARLTSINAAA